MQGRVVRFDDLKQRGTAMAFIDSVLPGHHRINYAVVGDTAVEDPDFGPALDQPHRFQIGIFEAPPESGPGWHTHEYVELFIPLTGTWRFRYAEELDESEEAEQEVELGPWDAISFPPKLWRAFANVGEVNAWCLAVLDPHEQFAFKDPLWPESVVAAAAEHGVQADERGRMIKPDGYEEMEREIIERIRQTAVSR